VPSSGEDVGTSRAQTLLWVIALVLIVAAVLLVAARAISLTTLSLFIPTRRAS